MNTLSDLTSLQALEAELLGKTNETAPCHVRVVQRNARKYITTIEGLPENFKLKKILKVMKKEFSCNGSVQKDKKTDKDVIQLSGDQREKVRDCLVKYNIMDKDAIKVHGF